MKPLLIYDIKAKPMVVFFTRESIEIKAMNRAFNLGDSNMIKTMDEAYIWEI